MLSTFTTDMLSILGVFYVLKLCPILIGFMLTQFKIYKIFLSVQYFDDKFKLILYPRIRNSTTKWRQKELFLLLLILQLGKSPFYVSSKNNTPATDLLHTQMSQNYYINLIFIWYKHKLKMWLTPWILCLVLFKTGKSILWFIYYHFK